MFNGLLYLVIALLMIAFSGEAKPLFFAKRPLAAFMACLLLYALLLLFTYRGCRRWSRWVRKRKSLSFSLANISLFIYLSLFLYLTPAKELFIFPTLVALLSLAFYFGGLAAYHAGSFTRRYLFPGSERETRRSYTMQQLRMWLPFTLPFLLFTLLSDLFSLLPEAPWAKELASPEKSPAALALFFGMTIIFFALLLTLLPYFIQRLWLLEEIEDRTLSLRLERICRLADFRCAGLKTWTVMNNLHTAAIIGLIPRFRYIMFTKRLLFELPAECIEAILVHEIGHSYRHHLLIYPFILFGMFIAASLISLVTMEGSYQLLQLMEIWHPSPAWDLLYPLILLLTYIAAIALYFRIVFGFFSRLFERQADLHCYVVGTPVENMIAALDQIGIVTGNSHDHPSWHHYSIRERIAFLKGVEMQPKLFEKHNRRVKRWVTLYMLLFAIASLFLLSTDIREGKLFGAINESIQGASHAIKEAVTPPVAWRAAEAMRRRYALVGDPALIDKALMKSFDSYLRYYDEGLVEYYAAELLKESGENGAATQLMALFWKKAAPYELSETGLFHAKKFTESLLNLPGNKREREELSISYQQSLKKSPGEK